MQQTENLKLNLIETGDPISPVPLNENMDKIEAALTSEIETRQAETADLDHRLQVFEARHFVVGSYVGTGMKTQDIALGFTPQGVLAQPNYDSQGALLALNDEPGRNHYGVALEIIPNGFRVTMNAVANQTQKNKTFYFVAFD